MQALLDAIATMAFPTGAQRLFHGRGGRFPGCEHLALDAYPPVWLLTSFRPLDEAALAQIGAVLAARWRGLGTTLTTLHLADEARFKEALGIPEEVQTVAMIPIGYPTGEWRRPKRGSASEVTHWDRWGEQR